MTSVTNKELSRPIKIAMVAACPFPANHGTPGAIRELSMHLVKLGHEVHVITYPQAEEGISVEGLHIHRVSVPFLKPGPIVIGPSLERLVYDLFLVIKLVQVIFRQKIDVIHAHNYEANIAGAIARVFSRKPLIYNAVTSMAGELPSYNVIRPRWLAKQLGMMLDRIVPRMSDLIMVLSDELKDELTELGNPVEKILIVPPGVDFDWLSSGDRNKMRSELGVLPATPIVMYTGALEKFQRVDLLLEAMAVVSETNSQAKLYIVTNVKNDDARNEYVAMANRLGIAERVHFVEDMALGDLPHYLAAADVTVVPRPSCPGYPIKLLNYMAVEKPVVSFAGSAKSLCHGYSGYIAKDEDVSDFARGINLFLDNPEVASIMGARAKQSLEIVFDWPLIAEGVAATYRQLVLDRKQCSKALLSKYFKRSYTPILEPTLDGLQPVSQLLKNGTLVYPSLE